MTEEVKIPSKKKINPILSQQMEVRMYLEDKMKEDMSDEEILELFQRKFPWITDVTLSNIKAYRKKYVPNYQEMILQRKYKEKQKPAQEIEKEILSTLREDEETGEEFDKGEQQKINMIKAHKKVLRELWNNYKLVKPTTDEQAKRGYLVEMAKELSLIGSLEASERSFLSAMDDIRKAEKALTFNQYIDSICGWFLLRCFERAESKQKIFEAVEVLKTFLDSYKQTVDVSKDVAEANRTMLEKLYVSQKVREEGG